MLNNKINSSQLEKKNHLIIYFRSTLIKILLPCL